MRLDLESAMWAAIVLGAGPGLFWHGFRDLKLKRLIQNTPTSRIRSLAMGLVELDGSASSRSSNVAPFTGRPCVYWQVDIATRSSRNTWSTVHHNASGHPFYLQDETGVALVYPQGAQCKLPFSVSEECVGLSLPECYEQYMAEQGLGMRAVWRLGPMRFRERCIEDGAHVYVLGSAVPRARVLDISDGEQLQATGTEDVHTRRLQTLDHEVVATVRQGQNEHAFIISESSERSLTAVMGWRAGAELIGGPLISLAGLAYWLDHLSKGRWIR